MDEAAARGALRDRQGLGARYDAPEAPAGDLALARLGTAYFARKLNELSDADLDRPSGVAGWSRRHVVAHIGYRARALARLVEAARAGRPVETLSEPEAQADDVDFGATLPAHALRGLFQHSAIHLDVEWRDLRASGWQARVQTLSGEVIAIAQTPWLRARQIWSGALDLRHGGSPRDVPSALAIRMPRGPG